MGRKATAEPKVVTTRQTRSRDQTSSPSVTTRRMQTRGTSKEKANPITSPVISNIPVRGRPPQRPARQSHQEISSERSSSEESIILDESGPETPPSQGQPSTSLTAQEEVLQLNDSPIGMETWRTAKSTCILVAPPNKSKVKPRTFSGTVVSSQDGRDVTVKVTPSNSVNIKRSTKAKQAKMRALDHNYDVPGLAEWKKRMERNTQTIDRLKKDQKRLRTKLRRANEKNEKLLKSLMMEQKMHNETQQTLKAIMQSLQLEVVT